MEGKRMFKVTIEDENGVVKVLKGDFGIVSVGVVEEKGDEVVGHHVKSTTSIGHPAEGLSLLNSTKKALFEAGEDVLKQMFKSMTGEEPEGCDMDCEHCTRHQEKGEVQ